MVRSAFIFHALFLFFFFFFFLFLSKKLYDNKGKEKERDRKEESSVDDIPILCNFRFCLFFPIVVAK